jgi:hypothetical protein
MLTAAQLIKALKKLPPDTKVAQASDPEGNAYWFAGAISVAGLVEGDLTDEGCGDEDVFVLWPGKRIN